jgi:hypothetical protein
VRTQILRTRPELTSIIEVRKSSGFFLITPNHYFFLRDARDKRDTRENFLSRPYICGNVTSVTFFGLFKITFVCFVKYFFQLRKNCVIWFIFLSFLQLFSRTTTRDYESLVPAAELIFPIIYSPYAKCLVFGLKRKLSRLTSRLAPHIS